MPRTKTSSSTKQAEKGVQIGLRFQNTPLYQWLIETARQRGVAAERGTLQLIIKEKLELQRQAEQAA